MGRKEVKEGFDKYKTWLPTGSVHVGVGGREHPCPNEFGVRTPVSGLEVGRSCPSTGVAGGQAHSEGTGGNANNR